MADKRPYELTNEALSVANGDFLIVDSSTKPEAEKLSALYYAPASHTHDASAITSGQFANARISYANVAQHIGSIDHGSLLYTGSNTHGQIDTHIASPANVHGIGTTANVVGTDTVQTLWYKRIKHSFVAIPNQQHDDRTMVGWQRNELANAQNRATITTNWVGAGMVGPGGSPGDDFRKFFDQSGEHGELLNLDGTTTSLEIIIDFGGNQPNYARANWMPFFAYRFAHPNGLESFFNAISFQISADGVAWDSPAGGDWSTTDFENESVNGVWVGGMAAPTTLASYRYVRVYLSDFQYNVGAPYAEYSWISQIGFIADAAPPYRIFVRSDIDDTKYGNLTVTGNLDVTGVLTAGGISGGGEANTASNLGVGEGVYASKSGVDLRFKSLVAGDNVTLTSDANTITIDATGTGGGINNAYSYMTDGVVISTASSTDTFKFRSANSLLDVQVQNNDATHGDNLLLTVNAAPADHTHDTIDTGGVSSNWAIVANGSGGIAYVTHDGIWGAGGYTHTQIDSHLNSSAIHIDWTQASQGTIHATNYVDNDTTDHTALSNIGTNTHAQIDSHIASTSNPHSVTAAQVGAAESSHTHTASDIDSGVATDGYVLTADGAGNAAWEAVSGTGGVSDAYTQMTDGTTTAAASGEDIFKFRSANSLLTVAVGSNDATHGDNLLFTVNEGSINHDNLSGFVANEHIDWTQASQGTIHATNYVDNDTTDHTALSNIGTNTHAQIDSHIATSAIHIDWTQASQGTIHATNYVDNDTTDHTVLSNIGTNTHAQIDSHIASTNNPHSVTAAQVGAAESSHTHTASDIDSGAATDGYVLTADGAGNAAWEVVSGTGGISNAYTQMTDGTTTAAASGEDTFKFRSANGLLTVAVGSNDATHGDNLLLTVNESSINHDNLSGFVANEHIDWTQASQGTIHATNYVDNDTTDHTALSNIGTNTHAQIDSHIASTSNPHSVTAAQVGAAESSHTHTLADVTDSGALAALDVITAAYVDSGAATNGYSLVADGSGGASWQDVSGGGLINAYSAMTDGTTTSNASGGDTFKFRSANGLLTVTVGSNDATHGDNLLLTVNEGSINHDNLSGFVANEHIDWTQASQGTIHATNYVDNDTTDHTALSNIGTNTHAQIDSHIATSAIHIDWTQASQGTIHATNYVDNDTTDHTALSNIGTNTHAQIDSHIASTSNPHGVTAAQVGAAESSHTHTLVDITDSGALASLDAVTAAYVDSGAATNGYSLVADGAGGASWQDVSGGGISNAYTAMTDGTTTSNASGSDTFKFRSANSLLTVAVGSNDATHGDNLLFTVNEGSINHDNLSGFVANEHIDWTQASQGTIHATNYVDNDTTDHTALSNIGTNTHAQIDSHIASTSNPHSVTAAQVGAAESSHTHTLVDITDSGALAALDAVTAAYIDSGAATVNRVLTSDGAGGASWESSILSAYVAISDFSNTAFASGSDTITFRTGNNLLTVLVTSNDPTFGDNVRFTVNQANIDHDALTNYVAAEHIDWTQASQGTIHATNYVDNDTTDHTALSNIGTNTHAQIDSHIATSAIHVDWTQASQGTIHATNYVDNDTTDHTALSNIGTNTHAQIDSHIASTSNPHNVTAAQVDALPTDSGITSVSTTYTVLSTDAGKIIECNGTFTVTLPNSLDTGFQVTIVNIGTGTITLAASTTLQTKSSNTKLASQYGAATAYHAGSNVWRAFGDLTA